MNRKAADRIAAAWAIFRGMLILLLAPIQPHLKARVAVLACYFISWLMLKSGLCSLIKEEKKEHD